MADPFQRRVFCILGLPFDAIDLSTAVGRVRSASLQKERLFLSTPNLNWVVACRNDPVLRGSVLASDLSIVDGMPLVWVARCLGIPIGERVAGSAVFESLRRQSPLALKVFFFGGAEGVAEIACQRLNQEQGGLVCSGFYFPGFESVESMSSAQILSRINDSGADFVVVSLGAKKGQAWIENNGSRLAPPVISHLGAVVNFIAGTVRRAPIWMQKAGLEWVWRIKEEKALWRRYFFDGLAFLGLVATRVLPHIFFSMARRPTPAAIERAYLELDESSAEVILRPVGVWTTMNAELLREALRKIVPIQKNIRIELNRTSYCDSEIVGLFLQLKHLCRQSCCALILQSPTPQVARILKYSCVEYLLDQKGELAS